VIDFSGFPIKNYLSNFTTLRSDNSVDNSTWDCPFCGGKSTFVASHLRYIFRCYRCFEGGYCSDIWKGTCGLPQLIRILEKCSYPEAFSKINFLRGIPDTFSSRPQRPKLERDFWPRGTIPMSDCSPSNPGRLMLRRRGVEHLCEHCFYSMGGKYNERVLIPALWSGEVIGFEAKNIYPSQVPKTLYPDWFRKGEYLYSTHNWDRSSDFCVITESILDAETLGVNAIGLYGSSLNSVQFSLLLQLRSKGIKRLVWMLDADALKKEVKMIVRQSSSFFTNYISMLPIGEDPNSIGRSKAWEAVSKAALISGEEDLLALLLQREFL
jgi:hypothetical protein